MEDLPKTTFGRNLRAMRQAKGLTQQETANAIGVTNISINSWERGRSNPRRKYVDDIIAAFNVSEDDLLSASHGYYARLHGLSGAPPGAFAVSPSESRSVPVHVLGTTYASEPGEPELFDGEAMLYEHIAARHPNCYALEVSGSCMDRVFTSHDFIFVDPDMEPHDGCIAVMLIDGRTEARRVRMGRSTMMLVAESHGDYPDIVVGAGTASEAVCQGVVFWWQAKDECI